MDTSTPLPVVPELVPENSPKPKWPAFLGIVLILAVIGVSIWFIFKDKFSENENLTQGISANDSQFANWKIYKNDEYGFEINYPSDFVFQENPDGVALVGFWYSQSPVGSIGTKIYAKHSNFSSFEDFTKDMTENYIFELVKTNDNSLSDQQAREEVKKFDSQYSFETKKINNANVLVHNRTFFGVDGSSETYIWIGNGDYLLINGSSLDLNSFKFINTTQN